MNEPNDTPPTGQTVQAGQIKDPWFEVAEDQDGRFHWCLWTTNGRPVARSGIAYERRKDAVNAARNLAAIVKAATRIVQVTIEG